MQNIAIIDYGAGNTQSVINALEGLNVRVNVTKNEAHIRQADKVIFPGVGHAKAAMDNLKVSGLDKVILKLNQPVLGICLGMQLLCGFHTEGGVNGLGIFDVGVKKFDTNLKVPQIGWNQIENLKSDLFKDINEKAFMYLVHSYYVPLNDACIAETNYGIKYASALQKDNFFGVQFHPEKSGKVGARVLRNFLEL